jgi:hypothetical protein
LCKLLEGISESSRKKLNQSGAESCGSARASATKIRNYWIQSGVMGIRMVPIPIPIPSQIPIRIPEEETLRAPLALCVQPVSFPVAGSRLPFVFPPVARSGQRRPDAGVSWLRLRRRPELIAARHRYAVPPEHTDRRRRLVACGEGSGRKTEISSGLRQEATGGTS